MKNREPEQKRREAVEAPDTALGKGRVGYLTPKKLETVVAILLGVTTLLSAWASWIGSLHSGVQSINFTRSNSMASQGAAEYNLGMQLYLTDFMAWNAAKDYYYELESAKADGDQKRIELVSEKIELFKKQSVSDTLAAGIAWMEEHNADDPFLMPGMAEKYFASAQNTLDQSQELLEEGKRDNTKGDAYNLVTVIFSLTLFLLGIVGTFKDMPNRIAVLLIAVVALALAVIYMCTIPLPTDFAHMNFFDFGASG